MGGIPFSADEAMLRKDFGECGEIEKLTLPMNDEGRPKGIVFIKYKTKAGVEAALKFDGDTYGGRTLKVNRAGDRGAKGDKGKGKGDKGKSGRGNNDLTVCVRGLPFATKEDQLRNDFAECGELVACRMLLNDQGTCKGVAFIEYKDEAGVKKAVEFHETDYGGRTIYVSPAGEKGPDKGKGKGEKGTGKDGKGGGKGNNDLTVCVRGLPFGTQEEALKKDFMECGELEKCRMLLNDEGGCKGIAFIEYKDKAGMDAACKFNETDYGGRTIYVSPAGEGKGKDGKDGKDKGKGKDGKDKGKGKGKDKGKKGEASSESVAKNTGAIVAGTGEKKSFDDSDSE